MEHVAKLHLRDVVEGLRDQTDTADRLACGPGRGQPGTVSELPVALERFANPLLDHLGLYTLL